MYMKSCRGSVFIILVLLLGFGFALVGCGNNASGNESDDFDAAVSVVENFGRVLKKVSLMAPEAIVTESIQENYSEFVSPELLATWMSDPLNAPGRISSSPWPERIEILQVDKKGENAYEISGEIIEITSTELEDESAAIRRPVTLTVEKINDKWFVNSLLLDAYKNGDVIIYKNTQYGFNFSLPKNWEGYAIVTDVWNGMALVPQPQGDAPSEGQDDAVGEAPGEGQDDAVGEAPPVEGRDDTVGNTKDNVENNEQGIAVTETGPIKLIRHPQWSKEHRRQDIPIMIFTIAQWDALQNGEFHIGAAPVGPKELARNDRYVFALPARYNFAFPEGHEEVETILEGAPLQALPRE